MKTAEQIEHFIRHKTADFAKTIGFDKLTPLHEEWIADMVLGKEDTTLQAHRGSYKTTCVSIALFLLLILRPQEKIMFMRKTDADIKEVMAQVKKILRSEQGQALSYAIRNEVVTITTESVDQLNTNLSVMDAKGTPQLYATGMKGSITGKHFDRIFTDDIVNLQDRISKAEREATKSVYMELQNVKNKGGRIYNTGTPWHPEDCFTIMPEAKKYDCNATGIMSKEDIEAKRESLAPTLFAVNYELRHIASDNLVFTNPKLGGSPEFVEQGDSHIDAAYGGDDSTAFTIYKKHNGTFYVFGKLWKKHVDDVLDQILGYQSYFNAGIISCENNGDKGYLGKAIRQKGYRTNVYHEKMNKTFKILTYLKREWANVVFVEGTDEEYIKQVTDFTEEAEHDDAPDSLATCMRREFGRSGDKDISNLLYM